MTLRFNILGYEIARIELDLDEDESKEEKVSVLDKGTKKMSSWWVRRMMK